MNKIFYLFCIFPVIFFSQEYHFDYFIKTKSTRLKPDKTEWITDSFYDSKSGKNMVIVTDKDKVIATVYDDVKYIRHIFNVKKNGDKLNFTYKHSNQFDKEKNIKSYNQKNVIKVTKIDSLQFKIDIFKNSRQKARKISAVITLEKADVNMVNFRVDYTRNDEVDGKLKSLLDPKNHYIIKNERITYHSSNYIFDNSIERIQKVELFLKLPDHFTFKQSNHLSDFEE